jgi:PAS domain-containing protein
VAQASRSGVLDVEYRVLDGSGRVTWLHDKAVMTDEGGALVMHGVATDITQQKREIETRKALERKSRQLDTMLRLICDNVPDMIWAKDLEKKYIFANKAVCEILLGARDTGEPMGRTDLFFAQRERARHPENPDWHSFGEICRDTDQITIDAGCAQQFDEFGNVQGRFLFLDVRKAPLFDETGVMIGTVGSARDVTAAKEDGEGAGGGQRRPARHPRQHPGPHLRGCRGRDTFHERLHAGKLRGGRSRFSSLPAGARRR